MIFFLVFDAKFYIIIGKYILSKVMESILKYFPRPKEFNQELAKSRQTKFLSNKLSAEEKMELYNSSVKGDLDKLKQLIAEKKYSITEECSASGYYWTAIHYAAHYGFTNIVKYCLDYYKDHPNKIDIMNLQSNLGLSPLFIGINNTSNFEKKKEIIDLYVEYDVIDYDICSQKHEDIFEICKKNNLLEYFLNTLKED